MGLYRSLAGQLRMEITSADTPGFLDAMYKADIHVMDAEPEEELILRFTLRREDRKKVEALCEKRGDSLKCIGHRGLYWLGKRLLRRPVLLVGMALLVYLMVWIPTHVFFIQVEGNSGVPERFILEAAEKSGIRFGASRREVRSERMKNALLEAVPELQWAGVNTYGCVAVISVREKSIAEPSEQEKIVTSIVAASDGVILSATATAGSLLCQPGQAVVEGQVLISGYTDCGLSIQATRASGEIYARTMHMFTVIAPAEYMTRGDVGSKSIRYSLLIGKKRINLWKDSGISGATCGRMYDEYYITLPGGFQLPVALVKETVTEYECETVSRIPENAEAAMMEFAGDYLLTQLIAGNLETSHAAYSRKGAADVLEVTFLCTEMIGRQKAEEIGAIHG